jgi:hypothetical protein
VAIVKAHLGMNPRAERIGQHDLAFFRAAKLIDRIAIEQKMLAGAAADRHCEISKFWSGGDRHC